jgi:hypothetical protein
VPDRHRLRQAGSESAASGEFSSIGSIVLTWITVPAGTVIIPAFDVCAWIALTIEVLNNNATLKNQRFIFVRSSLI